MLCTVVCYFLESGIYLGCWIVQYDHCYRDLQSAVYYNGLIESDGLPVLALFYNQCTLDQTLMLTFEMPTVEKTHTQWVGCRARPGDQILTIG